MCRDLFNYLKIYNKYGFYNQVDFEIINILIKMLITAIVITKESKNYLDYQSHTFLFISFKTPCFSLKIYFECITFSSSPQSEKFQANSISHLTYESNFFPKQPSYACKKAHYENDPKHIISSSY